MGNASNETPDLVCAVDVGGTFTDCVLIDEDGEVTTAKAPSTADIVGGFFDSIDAAASKIGFDLEEVFENTTRLSHGTTISTNMVVEDAGAKTGLITTKGHQDAVRMMRGRGRVTGEPSENVFRVAEVDKPDSIVPNDLIRGIPERIDANGNTVVELNEESAREAVQSLANEGVDAIAVSLLWSFQDPTHEKRMRELIEQEAPEVYVSCSHEVSSSLGEYERTVATCINSIVGPGTAEYLNNINDELDSRFEFNEPLLLMQCNGGTALGDQAVSFPIMLIGSGPVGGLRASTQLVEDRESENLIATDMGGTSFEAGIVQDGDPLVQNQTVIESYPYNISKLDVESIGAGGGSIAKVDEHSQSLRVGPESAGANPGPACYRRGGEQPTVTDADLLLGYIDPDAQIGEHITPSEELAYEAIESLANKLGLGVRQTARGIYDVVNTKMANLMQNKVIGRGYDPRDFSLISYGGAGPIHAASYSNELGADTVVVPGEISPVWSAYGVSQSNVRYEFEEEVVMLEPFNTDNLQSTFDKMEDRGREMLHESGFDESDITFNRVAKMRYEGQVHEFNVQLPSGQFDEDAIGTIISRFESEYEQRYSAAARLPEARAEMVTLRSEPVGDVAKFGRRSLEMAGNSPPSDAEKSSREVYLSEEHPAYEVDVYDGTKLQPGNTIDGPLVIDLNNTSIVAHEDQHVSVDEYHDFEITL